ncbi:MAG: hypothetical protein ACR2LM_00405 [Pyrinomonadaceae bacterium]
MYLLTGGYLEVREKGNYRRDTPYQAGEVFRVAVEAGTVKYYKNGALLHQHRCPQLPAHCRRLNVKSQHNYRRYHYRNERRANPNSNEPGVADLCPSALPGFSSAVGRILGDGIIGASR